jgi:hypothetical protein
VDLFKQISFMCKPEVPFPGKSGNRCGNLVLHIFNLSYQHETFIDMPTMSLSSFLLVKATIDEIILQKSNCFVNEVIKEALTLFPHTTGSQHCT